MQIVYVNRVHLTYVQVGTHVPRNVLRVAHQMYPAIVTVLLLSGRQRCDYVYDIFEIEFQLYRQLPRLFLVGVPYRVHVEKAFLLRAVDDQRPVRAANRLQLFLIVQREKYVRIMFVFDERVEEHDDVVHVTFLDALNDFRANEIHFGTVLEHVGV